MMIPGVQKPHCEPPVATNAPANRSRSVGSRPSMVVTARPLHVKLVSISAEIDQENDWPQPQVRWALGLLIVNPAPWRPSL